MKAYQFFADCQSTEEAKKLYYRLAQQNHPDHGGDPETMKAINAEFERFCKEGPTGGQHGPAGHRLFGGRHKAA